MRKYLLLLGCFITVHLSGMSISGMQRSNTSVFQGYRSGEDLFFSEYKGVRDSTNESTILNKGKDQATQYFQKGDLRPKGHDGRQGHIHHLTSDIFVDGSTKTPFHKQNGSIAYPYSSIQRAIDTIPAAKNAKEMHRVYYVFVAAGTYKENLKINASNKRIGIIAMGGVALGKMTGLSWTPAAGDHLKNIDITFSATTDFGTNIRDGVVISAINSASTPAVTFDRYTDKMHISGHVNIKNTSSVTGVLANPTVQINGEVFGNVDTSGGGATTRQTDLAFFNADVVGNLNGGILARMVAALNSQFEGTVNIHSYGNIVNSLFLKTITVFSNAGIVNAAPKGFFGCDITAPFASVTPGVAVLVLDTVSNFFFVSAGDVLLNGATKLLVFSTVP